MVKLKNQQKNLFFSLGAQNNPQAAFLAFSNNEIDT